MHADGLAFIGILIPILISLRTAILQPGMMLTGHDISQQYNWEVNTRHALSLGQIPLWNPFIFSGFPALADFQTAVLYPRLHSDAAVTSRAVSPIERRSAPMDCRYRDLPAVSRIRRVAPRRDHCWVSRSHSVARSLRASSPACFTSSAVWPGFRGRCSTQFDRPVVEV